MPDTDALARRAYEAYGAALALTDAWLAWGELTTRVQQAWRRVVETVRDADETREREESRG